MTTERLIFRAWEENDAADLFELASDPQIGPEAGWPSHKSVEDSLQIIRNVLQTSETYALIRKEDNRLIGCAGLKMGKDSCSEKQDEPELGYWIGKQFWGNGYATEAGERLLRHAFEDMNSHAVWCCYYDGNARSKRVQEKLGFTYVRTDQWYILFPVMKSREYRQLQQLETIFVQQSETAALCGMPSINGSEHYRFLRELTF